jgi:hypothetical protein
MIGVAMFGYFTVGSLSDQIHLLACAGLGNATIVEIWRTSTLQ